MSKSRPAWARGLKHLFNVIKAAEDKSRPAWARGLKLLRSFRCGQSEMSRPAWARGLKLQKVLDYLGKQVTPCMGAWIETLSRSVLQFGL